MHIKVFLKRSLLCSVVNHAKRKAQCALSGITNVSETSRSRMTLAGLETGLMKAYDITFPGRV